MTASFRSEGFEILPADNIVGLLFLHFCSIVVEQYFLRLQIQRNGFLRHNGGLLHFFCSSNACARFFLLSAGATDIYPVGQPYSGVVPIVVLEFTPLFGLIHQLVQRSDFTVLIVSANIAVLLMAVLLSSLLMWIEFFPICG